MMKVTKNIYCSRLNSVLSFWQSYDLICCVAAVLLASHRLTLEKMFVTFNLQYLCNLQLKVSHSQSLLVELDLVHLCKGNNSLEALVDMR